MNPTIQLRAFSTSTYLLWLKERGLIYAPSRRSPLPEPLPLVEVVTPHQAQGQELRIGIEQCVLCPRARGVEEPSRATPHLASLKVEEELSLVVFVDAVESQGAVAPNAHEVNELLEKMLNAIQLKSKDYRVFPSVFCGTTQAPAVLADLKACLTHGEHLALHLRPRVILALGELAAQTWAGHAYPWANLRGKLFYPPGLSRQGIKIPVLATYHPRDLLRFPEHKKTAWEDLKRLRSYLDGQAKKQ